LIFEGNLLSLDNVLLDGYLLHRQAEVTLSRSKSFKLQVKFIRFGVLQKAKKFAIDVEASDALEGRKGKDSGEGTERNCIYHGSD